MLVRTWEDRDAAVRSFLLAAAFEPGKAPEQWAGKGLALLRCGGLLGAVRISTGLVRAAAGTDNPREVDAFLAEALPGGPVFVDRHAQWYYVLVPAGTGRRVEWATRSRHGLGAEFLGMGSYLGVPRPEATDPEGERSYWCVPMDRPGALADPDAVSRFLALARRRHAQAKNEAESHENDPPHTPGTPWTGVGRA
ncbi:hypothetical protein [Streptomyces ipomoeae]|uniref:Uncharacterized protein n=2 Tax=Streptomyces ipomoeae TaxID=103232 RepID=L1KUX3_9ACTN|nr:hypothetical protein [Streptomyces ipomoeae]EKX64432.1 hypothetical protein STRIP9103_01075 [Streptomyces ipomoeae 91-03]